MKEFISKATFTAKIIGYGACLVVVAALLATTVGLPMWVGGAVVGVVLAVMNSVS